MLLNVYGNINRYYVQTLCMVFFPGSTFGENEEPTEGKPEVTVKVYNDKDNNATAYVSIKLNDKISETTETVSRSEEINIATHEAIAVGRAIFAAGKELLGHIPPWGILTGVRPAKVAAGLLMSGKGIIKSKKILRDEYFLNPQKAALAVSVASTEMRATRRMPEKTCSIYVSIPFCYTQLLFGDSVRSSCLQSELNNVIQVNVIAELGEKRFKLRCRERRGCSSADVYRSDLQTEFLD